jgi:hypothetical protein
MATMAFEDLEDFDVQGSIEVYEVTAPRTPAATIRTNQDWKVEFDWQSSGLDNHIIAGNWHLSVFLEQMGPGEAPALPTAVVPLTPQLNRSDYQRDIVVPAGRVRAGLYKLVASITHTGPPGQPSRVGGFAEGPLLQFYDVAP